MAADEGNPPYSLGGPEIGRIVQRRQGVSVLEVKQMLSDVLEVLPQLSQFAFQSFLRGGGSWQKVTQIKRAASGSNGSF